MAERGVFAVDRGVFDHAAFAPEPYTEREAWLWLIGAAAWKPMRVRAGRAMIDLERGQLAFAERFLATKFRWSKSRVHRFLKRLKSEAMVTFLADHETNLITICNYDKYAFDGTGRKPQSGPPNEPLADQPRTKEEELLELKEEEKRADARGNDSSKANGAAKQYAFEGSVIRLSPKHFSQWKQAFAALDLNAELVARDAWLAKALPGDRDNWFISTSKYLANRNMEARNKQQAHRWPSGIEGVV